MSSSTGLAGLLTRLKKPHSAAVRSARLLQMKATVADRLKYLRALLSLAALVQLLRANGLLSAREAADIPERSIEVSVSDVRAIKTRLPDVQSH